MVESRTTTAADEARRMLDIFASVGARAVDATWTNEAGDKLSIDGTHLAVRLDGPEGKTINFDGMGRSRDQDRARPI
jgi:hypothetical protein